MAEPIRTWTVRGGVALRSPSGRRFYSAVIEGDGEIADGASVVELAPVLDLLECIHEQGPLLKVETASHVADLLRSHGRLG